MKTEPILLVEDDDNDVTFMRYAWKKAAMPNPLYVVTDGEAAVDYLSGTGAYADRSACPFPAMVLLDLNLPGRHGFEVLKWLREQEQCRTLLVVVLTASSADSDAHRAYALGANSYVIKPSNPDKLREFLAMLKGYWGTWNYLPAGAAEKSEFDAPPRGDPIQAL